MSITSSTRHLLLIDDDSNFLKALFDLIGEEQPQPPVAVDFSSSTEAALDKLVEKSYALVLLNIEMPGAFDLLAKLRAEKMRVCLLIAPHPESLLVARFIDCDFLIKPFDREMVLGQLKRISVMTMMLSLN
ncbi:hypothetical protein JMG10_14645 [Nostoc ellipsosporum NOK]|jgi:DNA-binding response OmpR family regulator|nr:hypothetical protein [Nostoc ellipsosporum NOK]